MIKYLLIIVISLVSCKEKPVSVNENYGQINNKLKTEIQSKGFLFIDISRIYHQGGELVIKRKGESEISFRNKEISINGSTFDIINDESKYKKYLSVNSFFPEYGIFILKCETYKNGSYDVKIGNSLAKINFDKYSSYLTFKTPEQFVMEGYPNPTENNPLRTEPSQDSKIIHDFLEFTYISVEVKGDWLKIRDDKDCYSGEKPSEKDIIGWVRWRKDGKLILDVRHIC